MGDEKQARTMSGTARPRRIPGVRTTMCRNIKTLFNFEPPATELEIHAKEVLRVKKRMNEILMKHTGHTLEQIERDTDRDKFMTSDEAKSYGLIDNVLERLEVPKTA